MRKVCLLGASGSIGGQSLDLFRADRKAFELVGISVGKRVEKIPAILRDFPSVTALCVQRREDRLTLEERFPALDWFDGDEGLLALIERCGCDMVENALVGFAGLRPSIRALELDKILALANKESLVVGGDLINALLKSGHGRLYPIDSEHVAIAKLLSSVDRDAVDKILITASGGSFRNLSREELANVTPAEALRHPTWSMGAKITIDSATMMNKGFEVIEAKVLFDFPLERTEILMHPESHVHSLLRLKDGSYLADVSSPDMHGPIAYALYESRVDFSLERGKALADFAPYHFAPYDPRRYDAPRIALKAFAMGGTSRAVLNAANEEAVYAFLDGKIRFLDIERLVELAIDSLPNVASPTLEQLISADEAARRFVSSRLGE